MGLMTSLQTEPDSRENLNELLLSIKAGNQRGFEELYQKTRSIVYGYLISILRNKYDAEDIMHDTYISVYISIETYQPGRNSIAWILTIAKNNALMRLRNQNKSICMEQKEWEEIEFKNHEMNSEDKFLLHDLLGKLSDDERQIVILHAITGMKHKEIGKFIEKPLPTVLSKYNRAMKKMKNLYKERAKNE